MTRIELAAPAKINLFLHITGKRANGYHELESLVGFADVADHLRMEPGAQFKLTIDGPLASGLSNGDDNLVAKAVRFLATYAKRPPNVHVTLTKALPVASGIGGGSSDAATALLQCQRLWNIDALPPDTDIAAALGADVPVCLRRRASWMSGIGEEIRDVPGLQATDIVLVNPGVALNTANVFRAYSGPFSEARDGVPGSGDLHNLMAETQNDLEPAAIRLVPDIAVVLSALKGQKGCWAARMSGSGATCFGMFQDRASATQAALNIQRDHGTWWVAPGRLGADL